MKPSRSASRAASPAATALARRAATTLGAAVSDERRRRRWTAREVARRAHLSTAAVSNVEAGRVASLETYARIAVALGLRLDVVLTSTRRGATRDSSDLVHAAMGEIEAERLATHDYELAIDHPYQHYQFAGRADILAWTRKPASLLHIENRTRFPDLQEAAGSYNAKRQYLAATLARSLGIGRFGSETHVMVGLWSAEVIHSVRLRAATFRALCPDTPDRFEAWLRGQPPDRGHSSSFVLLDPFTRGRQASTTGLARVIAGARPRMRGYREADARLR